MCSRKSFWLLPLLVVSCVLLLTASIPNVPTGTWQTWNPMGDVRSGAAAVLLQDGRVLITGGNNANGPVASADLFGTDGSFSAATAMQTPRSGHTATVLTDGRVLVTGGTTSGGGAVNTAEIYDLNANSWSAPTTMVTARAGHTASLLSDGRVLLAGGHDSAGNALSSLEVFDPASGAFSSVGAMSSPRMNHAAATLGDGRVLLISGTADGTTAMASIDTYDPAAGTVSAGPALSTPRMSATATTTLDGKVAVIGGNNGSANGSQDLVSAEIYDPSTGQFAPSASNLVTARSGHQAFLLPKNNSILILGGSSAGSDLNSAELYYPWADTFQATGAMSVVRPGFTGSAISQDGMFLAAGGTNLASTELYGFATVKTDAADYPPGSTVTITGSGWKPGETVTLTLVESPLLDTHGPYTTVADANGNISDSSFITDDHDLSIRFYLNAVGSGSQSQAQNTFTDSNITNVIVTAQSPSTVVAGNAATFNPVTVNFGGNATACTLTFSTSALPAGTSASFSPSSVTGANSTGNTPKTTSLGINTTAGVAAGTYTFTVTAVAGTGCNGGNTTSSNVTLTVQNSTNLSVSSVTGVFGQTVNMSATLTSGSPAVGENGQTVNFTLNGNAAGSATTNSSGVASRTTSLGTIAPGTYATGVAASFTTNGPTLGSTGSAQLIVSQANTTTSITNGAALGTATVVGQAYTVNYSVAVTAPGAGTPTGNVTVSDGTSSCTGTVAAGTCSLTSTSPGAKTITASYGSDANFVGSTSSSTAHTVNAASTTTALVSSQNPSVLGQSVTFTATVTVNSPGTGTIPAGETVTFKDGAGTIGTGTTNASGVATLATSTITAGNHSITAVYAGNTNFSTSTSTALSQVVNKRATTTSVSLSPSTLVVGQPGSATVTVTDTDTGTQTNPTGTVTFSSSDAGDTLGTCTLAPSGSNAATCTASVTPSKVGTSPHTVTATFLSDSTHATSNGNASLTVNKASTTTAITSNTPNPSTVGQAVTINYSVSVSSPGAGTPTGNVTVSDSLGDTCTASVGSGTCQITFNTAGTKTLTATYAGDANFNTSASGGTSQTVNPKLVITSTAFAILTGTCSSQVTVQTQNNDGTGANGARTLNLSSSSGSSTFYNDAACSSPTSTASIGASASTASFFYRDTNIGGPVITAASAGLTSTTQTEAITSLRFNTAAFSVQINSCSSAITLQSANAQSGSPTSLTQATTINLSSSSANGKFYSDPACTTQITSTVIGNGFDANHDSPNFYYEDTSAGSPTLTASAGTASAQQAESVVTPPRISKAFGAATIPVSGTTTLTLTITNPTVNTVALNGVAFTDNLPAGVVVATPSGLNDTCAGTATATTGSGSVSLNGGNVAVNSSCKVTVNVTGTTSGVKNNTTGSVTSTNGGTGNTASASITVASPPTISKTFGAASIPLNASTSLTFTINNPNTIGLTGLAFTDGLPAGLVVATPNGLSSTCGTATAVAGSGSVSLSGGTVATNASCSISVNVTGTTTGVKNNTTGAISATESGPGAVSNTASLTVNTRSSSTTIAPLTATAAIGQGINFTVTVTDTDSGPASTPTGNVGVSSSNGTDSIGACTLAQTVAGTAACSVTITPAAPTGTHNISASFTANDNVHGNSSTTTNAVLTVTNPATSTTLMSSPNPSTFGQSVNFSAIVGSAAGTPTGSVTFYEGSCGGTLLAGPVALDVNGQAPFSKSDFNAGSHTVFACYTPTGIYLASSGSLSQQVNQAHATLSFGTLTFVYDGNLKPITVTTSPANLTGVSILYNGSSTPPMNAGSTPVTASLSNANYVATPISDTEVIQQAPVAITVTDPNVTYDGNTQPAIIGVIPYVSVMATYNGSPTLPSSAGVYTVMVTVTDSNYLGTGSGTLTINKATPTINWANPADISYGTALNGTQLNATATFNSNPVPGTFTYTPAAGTVLPAGNGQTLSVAFAPTDSTDFNSVPFTTVLINVKADPLYVISPDNSRPFGASDSPLTPTLSPTLVNGDTAQSIGGPTCNAATTTSSAPGTYAIVCSGVTSNNYSVTYINGTLSITNPLTAITAVTDTQGGTIQIGQTDQLTATGQFADNHTRTLASAGGLSFGRANLATPVFGAAVAEAGGVLYAIGGSDGTNTLGAIQAYNPKTNTWNTISAALATARSNAAAASVAGRIYVIGGSDGSKQLASIEVLDTTSGTPTISTFSGTASVARSDAAAVVWDQKLYVIGGSNGGSPQSTVDIFDLVLGTALTADAGIALDASAAVLNNKLYVLGTSGSSVQAVNFDGSNWSAPSATPLDATQGIGVTAYNNLLYIVNGTSVWSYDGTNFTQESNPLGHAHNGAQPVAIGSRIYVASAGSGSANSNLDAFAPPEVTWAPTGTNHADANIDQSGNVTALARTDNANPNYVTLTATSIANNSLTGDFQLTIDRKSQTITFGPLADKTYGDADFSVSATASSTLSVTFGASGNCNVSGTTVHIIGAGSCSITSSQGGDDEWLPATDVMQLFNINKANATIAVTGYTVTYDGNAHTATGTATGAFNEPLAGLDLIGTSHTDAGTYTDNWAFTDSTGNYNNASGSVKDCIKKANAAITVTPYSVTYDGNPHTATGTAKGVESPAPVDLTSLLHLGGTTHTNAGDYPVDAWTFDGNNNYNTTSGTVHDAIAKANAAITVTPYSVTYDGNAHTATGTAKGVESPAPVDLTSLLHLGGTTHTNAGDYPVDAWTFDGNNNYNATSGTVHDAIAKANAAITVTPYSVTYDGNAHTATGTAKGVESPAPMDLTSLLHLGGTTHTNAGDYPVDAWTFDGNNNYNTTSGTVHDAIAKANAAITVTPYSVTYDGNAHTATGTAKGVESPAPVDLTSLLHLGGTTHTNAGDYPVDAWTFDGNNNYNTTSGTVHDAIAKANAAITVTPYSVTYDGNAHTATGTAKGVESPAPVDLTSLLHLGGTTHTNAGDYPVDAWTFDGNNNYNTTSGTVHDAIAKANAAITVTPYSVTYDGNAHTATGTAKGVESPAPVDLTSLLHLGGTTHTNAGDYPVDAWTFDGNNNYNTTSGTVHDAIAKANAAITVTPYSVTYDGNAHTATVTSITGVNGETGATVGTVTLNTTHTDAGTYASDSWSFTGTANYNNIASTTITDTINKATAVVVVTPYSVTYDGNPHSATITSIIGVNGETGATVGTVTLNTTHTAAGTYASDSWSFTGTANYNNIASTPITDTINKATAVVVVTPYTVTYDGSPHTATVTSITGVNGETGATVGTVDVGNTAHTPAGTYSSDLWSFTGTANYNNIASTPITDSIAQAPLTITASSAAMFYGGMVPPVTAGYSGFVNGEGSSILTTQPSCVALVTSLNPIGFYVSTCSGAAASNYMISYMPGVVTVSPATTTTTVISSVNPSNWGQVVTLTATVSAPGSIGTPTGTVSFYNAASGATCASPGTSTLLDKEPLATIGPNQQASTSTPTLPVGPGNTVGNDTILACYNGDSTDPIFNPNFAPSSGALTQTVNPAPIGSLSPTSLSFGNQQGGTTSGPQYVYVSNPTGTASLSIASITLTGTNPTYFTETNNCTSVAIGGSCTITVKFAPPANATGVATANLVVTDNSGNVSGSRQSSLLTGAGTSSISSVGSLSTYAIFATANGCSSLNVSGNGTVDSFNSSFGPYGSSHQNSGGNVGTDGNVTLSGNPVVYGTAASPFGGSGNCSTKSMTGYSTSGKAQATGGQVALPQALTYPAPSAPNPTPPTTTQNISGSCGSIAGCVSNGSKNVILAPGVYGNLSVSGGTMVNVSGGTYNMNSLTLSGNSTLVVTSGTGAVVVNLAGKSVSGGNPALDLSGGVMSNASGLASNLQFYYAGAQPIKLSGGAGSYAVVYAPNAPINVSGGAHFYGAMVGSTINSSGGTAFHYDGNLPNIQAGNFVWFNSAALNVQGLPTNGSVKVYVTNASISFPSTSSQCTGTFSSGQCTLPVPNAVVTFSSTASTASTTWDAANSRWSTLVPTNGSTTIQTHTFLDGLAYLVPNGGFPSGIQNVTWSAAFSTSTTGISFNWQWGAAVYNSFTNNYSSLPVNPVDGSDPAGTPQNYKSNLIFGATGPGYTGLYVGTAGVVPTIAEASAAPSSLDFGSISQTIGTGSSTLTATLNNNQSGPLTISSITVTGTNPSDFGQTNNCPISPATLAGGSSCTITVTFTPTAAGKRTAKIAVNDSANNSPQTVFLKGTGQ